LISKGAGSTVKNLAEIPMVVADLLPDGAHVLADVNVQKIGTPTRELIPIADQQGFEDSLRQKKQELHLQFMSFGYSNFEKAGLFTVKKRPGLSKNIAGLIAAIKTNDPEKILLAIEQFPPQLSLGLQKFGKTAANSQTVSDKVTEFLSNPNSAHAVGNYLEDTGFKSLDEEQQNILLLALASLSRINRRTTKMILSQKLENAMPVLILRGDESDETLKSLAVFLNGRKGRIYTPKDPVQIAKIKAHLPYREIKFYKGGAVQDVSLGDIKTKFLLIKPKKMVFYIDTSSVIGIIDIEDILPVIEKVLNTNFRSAVLALIAA
jgi:hypothetical protein